MNRRGSSTLTGEIVTFDAVHRRKSKLGKNVEEEEEEEVSNVTGPKFGKRHVQTLCYFFIILFNQCNRQHLSLTIVAMMDSKLNEKNNIPTLNWTNRNVIISSFFWGYIGPQVITGWLMTKYGPKWFLISSSVICSLLSCMIPWFAIHCGSTSVIIVRVLQGLCQSFMIPSVSCFMSRWIPVTERSRTGAFIIASSSVATVISMPISGAIAASPYGWPMTYYAFGGACVLSCVLYGVLGSNSPSTHKSITEEERSFIVKTAINTTVKGPKTPWGKIVTCVPFWACVFTTTCMVLLNWIFLSQIPTYMSKIMRYDLKSNGLLTSLIYLTQWAVCITSSIVADFLINKNYLRPTLTRKLFTAIGMIVPSASLFLLAHCTEENYIEGVVMILVSVGAAGANWSACCINNLDLAPNFAGVLQGFINGISHVFALLAPLIVQVIVHDESDPAQWQKVFYMSSGVAIMGVIVYSLFGSGEEQPFNKIEDGNNDEETALK
ncbi:unnamed protein product [Phyllotreta striolata]|uniref:Major facilitator superfamily (MFS) profile domain-containing protein n=1 Tax=Phyllotreta striolata TaxID=444603 RepID=A0A9N9TZ93_PHYSR|nr:unnamed protein product [Phyllotreta striolata]